MLGSLGPARMSAPRPLAEIARDLAIDPLDRSYLPYGHDFAKIDTAAAGAGAHDGKLVVVSAITPTPLGEGKTVTSISLTMGLNKIGARSIVCLRQPSLGPVFGSKGGGAGGCAWQCRALAPRERALRTR